MKLSRRNFMTGVAAVAGVIAAPVGALVQLSAQPEWLPQPTPLLYFDAEHYWYAGRAYETVQEWMVAIGGTFSRVSVGRCRATDAEWAA